MVGVSSFKKLKVSFRFELICHVWILMSVSFLWWRSKIFGHPKPEVAAEKIIMLIWQLFLLLRQQQTLKVWKSEFSREHDHNTTQQQMLHYHRAARSWLSNVCHKCWKAFTSTGMILDFVVKDTWMKKRKQWLRCSWTEYICVYASGHALLKYKDNSLTTDINPYYCVIYMNGHMMINHKKINICQPPEFLLYSSYWCIYLLNIHYPVILHYRTGQLYDNIL